MFEWDVSKLQLIKGVPTKKYIVKTTSRKDKIAFVDSLNDGKLSYFLSLSENLQHEVLDHQFSINDVKSWLIKNDSRDLVDKWQSIGKLSLLGIERYIMYLNTKGYYESYSDFVDACFMEQLRECERQERMYSNGNDEYAVCEAEVIRSMEHFNTNFGVSLLQRGTTLSIVGKEGERPLTLKELKKLETNYIALEQYISDLTDKTDIHY